MVDDYMTDAVVASADLVRRAGGVEFEISWDCPHLPTDEINDDHSCPHVVWTCSAQWKGHRLWSVPHPLPDEAATDLARKVLRGATCKCLKTVVLSESEKGCQWKLRRNRWEPGCHADPLSMPGLIHGDLVGMNRAARRAKRRRRNQQ